MRFSNPTPRHISRKNYNVAIEAIAQLNNPNLHYLICGTGQEMDHLKALASNLGVANRIHFLGFRYDIKELMASMPEQEFSLIELAEMANLSQWHFLRQFKKHVGLSPHAWLIQARLQKSQKLLRQGLNLSEVSQQCGFSDQSHFSRHFRQTFGITPGGYIAYLK